MTLSSTVRFGCRRFGSSWEQQQQQQQQQPELQRHCRRAVRARAMTLLGPENVAWQSQTLVRLLSTTGGSSGQGEKKKKKKKNNGGVDLDDDAPPPVAFKSIYKDPPPKTPIDPGHFKNPIVKQLWSQRQALKKERQSHPQPPQSDLFKPKSPSESQVSIDYNFSSNEFLMESYRNPWGQLRMGKVFEDLDALAGNVAFHHAAAAGGYEGGVEVEPLIVTASVDRIKLRQRPTVQRDHVLSGKVTYVGSSSMEIRMQCLEQGADKEWLEAYFTFVTLHPDTKKPMATPALHTQTVQEEELFEAGKNRAIQKKKQRTERSNIFSMTPEIQTVAFQLLQEAAPLLNMPSLADANHILAVQTKMQNALTAQPQTRNLRNLIFGGFLMRRAYELAFSTAYVFAGARPIFVEVDQVSFQSPVGVGDLLVFNSKVLYTLPDGCPQVMQDYRQQVDGDTTTQYKYNSSSPLVTVEVVAWVTEPEKASAKISNNFSFTFALPAGMTWCRRVLPSNMEEARRMALCMLDNQAQGKCV